MTTAPHPHIRPLHSYRVQLQPPGMTDEQAEQAAEARTLPELWLRAPSARFARAAAQHLSGQRVFDAQRVCADAAHG